MSIFIKNGHFCIVQKNLSEIQERYMYRGYAIVSKQPKTQQEFDKYTLLSNYLSNIKFLGCYYTNSINKLCEELDNNITTN